MDRRELLQQILAVSREILVSSPTPSASNDLGIPAVQIPPLRLAKLTAQFCSQLKQSALLPPALEIVFAKATELSAFYQRSYNDVCNRLLASSSSQTDTSLSDSLLSLRFTFETLYEQTDLPRFMHLALSTQAAHYKDDCPPVKERKFNYQYTPCLEDYFEHNAYPSAADRLLLARKSMMTPRQIEVWFQNHRNRAKKDGRSLKKLGPNDSSLLLSLRALKSRIPLLTIPDDKETPSLDSDSPDSESANEDHFTPQLTNESIDVLGAPAPSHAFPTKYPPNCVDDPFPTKDGVFTFPPVVWRRQPAVIRASQDLTVDVDELTAIFASKLSLREKGKMDISRVRSHHRDSRIPWFAATVTVLPPAPHPALLCSRKPCTNTSTTRLNPRLTPSYSEPFSGTPTPLCLSYPTHLRRRPSNTGITNAESTLVTQPRIPSSRISSFSSVGSRTSSWCSLAANDPITPPLSPTHKQGMVLTTEALAAFEEYLKTNDNNTANAFTPKNTGCSNNSPSFSQISLIQQHYGFNSSFLPVANCVAAQS